jgi:acetyl esterase
VSVLASADAEGYLLETETLRWFYKQYLGSSGRADDWRGVALLQADLSGLAPAYLAVAEYDPLLTRLAYAEALRARQCIDRRWPRADP